MRMKKLLTFLTLLTLFFTTAGAETVTYSLTPDNASTGLDDEVYIDVLTEFTYSDVSWKMKYWNPNSLQVKTNKNDDRDEFRFYNTSAFPGRITQVVITFSTLTVSDASKLMFIGGSSEVSETTGGTAGTWDSNAKTLTWTPGASDNFTFFGFYQNGKAASGNNYLAESDAIVVTYEESSTPATTYNVNLNQSTGGTISASTTTAAAGATVTLTATPDAGYKLGSVTVTPSETGVDAPTATINGNTATFTMPASNVEVEATFTELTPHAITVNGGSANHTSAYQGQTVTVTPTIPSGKVLDQITTTPELTLTPSGDNYTFTMPNEAVTVTITYKDAPTYTNKFERINNTSQLETGVRYLLVYESTPAVMGEITSQNNYGASVTSGFSLANNVVTLAATTDVKPVVLGGSTDAWTFEMDGSLIGQTAKNSLKLGADNNTWAIAFDNGNAEISHLVNGTSYTIRYNASSPRFAGYNNSGQKIYLYKEMASIEEVEDLYVVGQVNGNDENPIDTNEGIQLTYSQTSKTYSGDFYCTGVNNGNDSGYSFLLFSKKVPYSFSTNSDLYGAGGNGNAWTINESDLGTAIPLYAKSTDNFRLSAGLYTVTVALTGAGFEWTDASVTFTTREKTMVINGSQYFDDTREVTMTSNLTDIGGKIYYTTDGSNPSDPNSSRQEYTGAITINETTTFKAVAFVGNLYSAIVEKTFTKTPKTPVIDPNGGTITEATQVTITCETTGAEIYYTLDGSTPTNVVSETNFLYSEPFTITETTTVKARAYVGNTYSNNIATAEFVYTEPYVPGEGDFVLVDSKDDLKAGREYIIITEDYKWAMGAIDGDAKKATASQEFTISTDHSTVTLTENSTVNIIKLADGVVDPDNKYWNLTQTNGLNIFLQNTGTGIQEKLHGYGLSGYSDEVLINLTTTTNYAIITPGGRQILYQNGSNGVPGVFGHYANSNAGTSSYQRVYLYYREGATVPTPEMTLADICKYGVTTEGKNEYIIADKLQAVYAYTKGGNSLLWCKDLDNKSIVPTTIHSGQIDFMRSEAINYDTEEGVHNGQQGPWDQSNWIVLQFTNPTGSNNIDQMLQNAQDKFIKPGTIKGKLVDDVNYILKVDLDQLDLVTQADPDYDEEPYNENVYCPANFLPENLNIDDGIENGDGAETGNQNYFFMNPKVQEICYITYAQWDDYGYFAVPSSSNFSSGIDGAFQVGWVYQDKPALDPGKIYKFHAVVHRVGKEYGPQNPVSTKDGMPVYENITVLPIDLTADSEIVTSINTVETGNGEVKSVKYVNVAGMVSDVPFQGVNIVVTEYSDGSRSTSKMLRK